MRPCLATLLNAAVALLPALWLERPALAAPGTLSQEVKALTDKLDAEDRITCAYAAMSVVRIARENWGTALLGSVELRPWQGDIAPLVPRLVALLEDDETLQWTSNDDTPLSETSLRKEATKALLAVERASVVPLIVALDGPAAKQADQVLRQLVKGGPPGPTRAAWERWWRDNGTHPLTNEHGNLALMLALVAASALAVGLVIWRARRRDEAPRALSLRAPARS